MNELRQQGDSPPPNAAISYVVGIGASAGGLEALDELFTNMPADTGMSFVIIQHLDPTHKGMMPELLQRVSKMDVFQAEDGMPVRPNSVYVIPPNKDMSILHGTLQLLDPASPRGTRMPIDFFFRNLAEDQGERAICIILSGMGTDGTLGLKAVKEKLGMAMVQDPKSAKYDAMPHSAIDTGLVDYILPPGEMPEQLIDYVHHIAKRPTEEITPPEKVVSALEKIFVLLRDSTGHDFSFYKINTVNRRIQRRMSVHQIGDISLYVRYLQENPHELKLLFKELLIGVTSFFRDPDAWDALKVQALAPILSEKKDGAIRAWVVGCSTGEEAYSMAIVLRELLDQQNLSGTITAQVFATDIDSDAIDLARQGLYPVNIEADVPAERLSRYFVEENGKYRVSKEIREMVVFATQDVIMDPPFTKVDLVSCRNLLIYLAPEMQKKVIPVFHYSLNQGGALFLGPAETIGGLDELFSVINDRWKIFKRKKTPTSGARIVELPSSLVARSVGREYARGKEKEAALPEIIERILLDEYAPSAALINSKGEIIYIHGRTGKYLEPSPGKANLNMIMMAREGLKRELSSALHKAVSQKTDVTLKGLRVKTNGSEQGLDVVIRRFEKPESMRELLLILFQEVETPKKPGTRAGRREISPDERMTADELEKELDETRERLRITVEEMETTEEESKVATEELQSTNEELQSTNEELTTAKEELQSENEELMTVNSEMRLKNDQLEAANNDMRNLLNSISIATIFMDNELKIKRFTPQVTGIINLIPTDVGRPITDIASNLNYHDLAADSRNVLDTLAFKERQVQSTDGRWYLMRITPYRTAENYIDGIVVTFNDIDSVKRYEAERDARAYSESIVATVREPLVVLDSDLKVVSASRSFYKTFHVTSDQTVGRPIYDLGNRQWDIPELREFLENVLPKHTEFHDFRVEHDFEKVGHRVMLLNARQIQGESTRPQMILLAIEDIT